MPESHIINQSKSLNFISSERTVNIFGTFSIDSMSEMLAELGYIIDKLPFNQPFETSKYYNDFVKISNPYNLPQNFPPVVDVKINSGGGDVVALKALNAELDRAKAKGVIIRTYVMGWAGSSASLCAVQGTRGFRIMATAAYHYVHFGSVPTRVTQISEEDVAVKSIQRHKQMHFDIYGKNTNLTDKEISHFCNNEGAGTLYAQECLTKGLCDWIQTPTGYINKINKSR